VGGGEGEGEGEGNQIDGKRRTGGNGLTSWKSEGIQRGEKGGGGQVFR
jgi:hypothetical protein